MQEKTNVKLKYGENMNFGENLKKDLEVVKKYADKEMYKELKEKFTPHNFIKAVDNALKKIPIPEVTIEHVAKGDLAYGPKNKIFPKHGKIIIEVEINSFMGFWHTKHTVNIIKDVLKELNWKE